jgi:hypothetical protein
MLKNKNSNRILIIDEDMYQADLSEADVIFQIHNEGEFDLQQLFSMNMKNGTRLIKHDLPLLGYLPDRIDYPFYRMTFPLKKALSKNHWPPRSSENEMLVSMTFGMSYFTITSQKIMIKMK